MKNEIRNHIKEFENVHKGVKLLNITKVSNNSYRAISNIYPIGKFKITMAGVFYQGIKCT